MADSGSGLKQFTEEMEQAGGEVVEEAKDQVGQAIEHGIQSVVGTQLTPQQLQQKQLDEQKQLAETRRKIEWYKKIELEQKKVREELKQKEAARLKQQEEEKKVAHIKKEEKKKQPINPATFYAGKVEFKRGVGG